MNARQMNLEPVAEMNALSLAVSLSLGSPHMRLENLSSFCACNSNFRPMNFWPCQTNKLSGDVIIALSFPFKIYLQWVGGFSVCKWFHVEIGYLKPNILSMTMWYHREQFITSQWVKYAFTVIKQHNLYADKSEETKTVVRPFWTMMSSFTIDAILGQQQAVKSGRNGLSDSRRLDEEKGMKRIVKLNWC